MMTELHRTHEDDAGLYLDDLQLGQRFQSGTYAIEEAQIKAFAAEFDPQPFHLDERAAQASIFKGLAAPFSAPANFLSKAEAGEVFKTKVKLRSS